MPRAGGRCRPLTIDAVHCQKQKNKPPRLWAVHIADAAGINHASRAAESNRRQLCHDAIKSCHKRWRVPHLLPATMASTSCLGACPEPETVHLTPWDLQMLTIDHIQKGILLPKPPVSGDHLVEHLASSFSRALARFHPFTGRLTVDESCDGDGPTTFTVSLRRRCTGDDGAEFVHAVAADVTVADVVASLYVPRVVWSFFPLDGMVGADAAASSRPVLAAQVTELADGVFVAMALNHAVADGTTFWHLFNTWSHISRRSMSAVGEHEHDDKTTISIPPPVFERWFPDGCPVPVPLPFGKLEQIVRRFDGPPVNECFFVFSGESIERRDSRHCRQPIDDDDATTTISSLQSVLAHVWRGVTRARRLPRQQETTYTVLVGCRGRVRHVAHAYAGNAVVRCTARATAGEVVDNGLGWTASLLRRAIVELDEAALVGSVDTWHRDPRFAYLAGWWHPAAMVTGNSPRFDVVGNDFGWGKPLAVRSGGANKVDGRATVYEGIDGGGSIGMEVCLAPEILARLVVDDEFMNAVTTTKKLPNEVLISIVEKLSLRDAVQMGVLSRRWRSLPNELPRLAFDLNDFLLDDIENYYEDEGSDEELPESDTFAEASDAMFEAMESLLASRRNEAGGCTLAVSFFLRHNFEKIGRLLDGSITSGKACAIELAVSNTYKRNDDRFMRLFDGCPAAFRGLRCLTMSDMRLLGTDFDAILTSCARLEMLSLEACDAGPQVPWRVRHARLAELTINNCSFGGIDLAWLPSLERFTYHDASARVLCSRPTPRHCYIVQPSSSWAAEFWGLVEIEDLRRSTHRLYRESDRLSQGVRPPVAETPRDRSPPVVLPDRLQGTTGQA
ncbi:hypothetical protein HU200_028414 [Digitaria exilis]|uniref:F-box domain-containing protein n=1 Tax=Digitaria exilis TaxID=1010633 RepID=A0A835BZT6_9POAL|nr:hypothetical protein HU200_028414 [Digitaria exilis]